MRRNINLEEVKYEAYKEGWEIGVKEGVVERRNMQAIAKLMIHIDYRIEEALAFLEIRESEWDKYKKEMNENKSKYFAMFTH